MSLPGAKCWHNITPQDSSFLKLKYYYEAHELWQVGIWWNGVKSYKSISWKENQYVKDIEGSKYLQNLIWLVGPIKYSVSTELRWNEFSVQVSQKTFVNIKRRKNPNQENQY